MIFVITDWQPFRAVVAMHLIAMVTMDNVQSPTRSDAGFHA